MSAMLSGEATPLWELRNIVKRYPGVVANDQVSLRLMPGEIHGLLGENGCGKSTLIKILSGVEQPTEGQILKDGLPVRLRTPIDARNAGIATVFQEFSLVPELSVSENIFLGRSPINRYGLVDWKRIHEDSQRTLDQLGLRDRIDPGMTVGSLSVAQQQLVEIAKAISIDAKTLILDEPTAALSAAEISFLHDLLRRLRSERHAILYISHRLDEVVSLIDVATVLKDGRRVRAPGEGKIAVEPLVSAMIGHDIKDHFPPIADGSGQALLEVQNVANDRRLRNASFTLHAGEILGIAGLMGSGRSALLRTIFGLERMSSGEIRFRSNLYQPSSPIDATRRGIALIPENRKSHGLFFNFRGSENATIAALHRLTRFGLLDITAERDAFSTVITELNINKRASTIGVGDLSGGNQQKILLARWMFAEATIFLLDEPTQGIDIGAKIAVYQLLRKLTRENKAVILVSSDLEELLALSNRIAILSNGILTEAQPSSTFNPHLLSLAIASGGTGACPAPPPRHTDPCHV